MISPYSNVYLTVEQRATCENVVTCKTICLRSMRVGLLFRHVYSTVFANPRSFSRKLPRLLSNPRYLHSFFTFPLSLSFLSAVLISSSSPLFSATQRSCRPFLFHLFAHRQRFMRKNEKWRQENVKGLLKVFIENVDMCVWFLCV